MRSALILLLLGLAEVGSAQDAMFSEMKDDRVLIGSRILPETEFNLTSMEVVAQRFIADVGAMRVLSRLSIYSRQDIAAAERGVFCEDGYLPWRVHYDGFPKGVLIAADVISVGENSVVRLRAPDGTVARKILRGKDPTQILVDEVPFEILFIAGRVRSRFEGCGVPGSVEPVLFLKTSAQLGPEICRRVTSSLTATLGVSHLWVSIRNDHWFLCSQFPVVFPFSPSQTPPSEAVYYRTSEFACNISCDGVARCTGPTIMTPSQRKSGAKR